MCCGCTQGRRDLCIKSGGLASGKGQYMIEKDIMQSERF